MTEITKLVTRLIPALSPFAAIACLVLSLLQPASLQAQAWNWHTEDVDPAGKFTSIVADHDGNVHLSYSDGQAIKYAFRPAGTTGKWFNMQIDGGDAYTSLAVDAQGRPRICYTARVLRYAEYDGAQWKTQTIATDNAFIGFSCALAISPDGSPHISWYREKNADNTFYTHIKFAELQDGAWVVRTLDFDTQTGKFESMTVDSNGEPVVSFDAYVKGLMKIARRVKGQWNIETVDFRGRTNNVYDLGMGNSVAIDNDGKPVISYEDGENIKFAHLVGDTWKIDTVDLFHPLGGWVGYRTSVAIDKDNHPHIAYDAGGFLKHAYWDGQVWHIEILARSGIFAVRYCSMAISPKNVIYISYSDPQDGSLKVAVGESKVNPSTALRSPAPPQ